MCRVVVETRILDLSPRYRPGLRFEQQQQYDAAFNKYMEAEFFASKDGPGQ